MKKRAGEHRQRPLRVLVLDCEALSLAVRGDREMIAWIQSFPNVWFATGTEVAEAWSAAHEAK